MVSLLSVSRLQECGVVWYPRILYEVARLSSLKAINEESILIIKNLSKKFGALEVLKDISLEVARSEVICILGRSGSGKSTLLRCINFLEKPTGGDVIFGGHSINYNPHSLQGKYKFKSTLKELRTNVGMVFQQFNLWPHKTILQNMIEAPVHVSGIAKKEAIRKAEELLKRFGLEDKRNEYPSRLSGGQQQRVAIVRALAMSPRVMLFDEVTSSLDPDLIGDVLNVMKALAEDGMTMLTVTHEIQFAREVSDTTIFIEEGLIQEQGPSKEMLVNPREERTRAFLQRALRQE